jgi:hypothetical protein
MVSTPSELGVERSLLSWLDGLGWETHGQDGGRGAIVLDEAYDRQTNEVVYWMLLEEQVLALNDDVTEENVEKFLSSLKRDLDAENLMDGNRAFHRLLTKGKAFNVQRDNGSTEAVYVDLIDYENPENNRFHAVNQFSVSRGTTIRPDVTLFVNGIPLVTMELKSVTQDNYYVDAIRDLHDYEEQIPRLFVPGLFNVAADRMELRYSIRKACSRRTPPGYSKRSASTTRTENRFPTDGSNPVSHSRISGSLTRSLSNVGLQQQLARIRSGLRSITSSRRQSNAPSKPSTAARPVRPLRNVLTATLPKWASSTSKSRFGTSTPSGELFDDRNARIELAADDGSYRGS